MWALAILCVGSGVDGMVVEGMMFVFKSGAVAGGIGVVG